MALFCYVQSSPEKKNCTEFNAPSFCNLMYNLHTCINELTDSNMNMNHFNVNTRSDVTDCDSFVFISLPNYNNLSTSYLCHVVDHTRQPAQINLSTGAQVCTRFLAISNVKNSLESLKLVMDGSIEEIVFSFLVVFVH